MLFPPDSSLGRLQAGTVRPGVLVWIGLRPARKAALAAVGTARLEARRGIEGDHYAARYDGARQITLIAAEDLAAMAAFLGVAAIAPERTRRNFVTCGVNLLALKDCRLRIGAVLLEVSGECHPCARMEAEFGPGGYNAMRGRGGLTARVIEGGQVHLGEPVTRVG